MLKTEKRQISIFASDITQNDESRPTLISVLTEMMSIDELKENVGCLFESLLEQARKFHARFNMEYFMRVDELLSLKKANENLLVYLNLNLAYNKEQIVKLYNQTKLIIQHWRDRWASLQSFKSLNKADYEAIKSIDLASNNCVPFCLSDEEIRENYITNTPKQSRRRARSRQRRKSLSKSGRSPESIRSYRNKSPYHHSRGNWSRVRNPSLDDKENEKPLEMSKPSDEFDIMLKRLITERDEIAQKIGDAKAVVSKETVVAESFPHSFERRSVEKNEELNMSDKNSLPNNQTIIETRIDDSGVNALDEPEVDERLSSADCEWIVYSLRSITTWDLKRLSDQNSQV